MLTEETDWIGGQLTQQAVPPDEHPWIETHGSTRWYREFRTGIRDYYRRYYPLTDEARARADLNPGDGAVSRLCHEPRVALAVLEGLLAPHIATAGSRCSSNMSWRRPTSRATASRSLTVRSLRTGNQRVLEAPYFIDATELGDLLPLTGTEFVTGLRGPGRDRRAARAREGRPGATSRPSRRSSSMDFVPGADHTIERPREYAFWRDYVPRADAAVDRPPARAREQPSHHARAAAYAFDPVGDQAARAVQPLALPAHREPRQLRARHVRGRPHRR